MKIKNRLRDIPANNFLNSKALFESRLDYYYDNNEDIESKVRLLDSKFLFGKVNRKSVPVILNDDNIKRFK